jgi:glycosyltransferase involved in cell wall biosynthesis
MASCRRIVLVISTLTHGGAEVQVKNLAQQFARRGWDVHLVVVRTPEAFVTDLRTGGVHLHSLDARGSGVAAGALVRLVRLLRQLEPEVVHSHMRGANILTRLARPFSGVKVLVCTAHNEKEGVNERGDSGSTELLYRCTDRLCDLTTNVSRSAVARYIETRAAPPDRIRYVPNGIDLSAWGRDREARAHHRDALALGQRPTAISIGRFHPQKNHEMLLDAFARVLREIPDAVLLLVGDGPLRSRLECLIEELGIGESVRLLGVRDDIPALLNAADCYVMSSRYEGLPVVLLEAAASHLPIVATAVGGNREIVRDGVTGVLVPPDDAEALSAGLLRILRMSETDRELLGNAGRAWVEATFDINRVVDTWEAIYVEVARRGQERRSA